MGNHPVHQFYILVFYWLIRIQLDLWFYNERIVSRNCYFKHECIKVTDTFTVSVCFNWQVRYKLVLYGWFDFNIFEEEVQANMWYSLFLSRDITFNAKQEFKPLHTVFLKLYILYSLYLTFSGYENILLFRMYFINKIKDNKIYCISIL